MGSWNPLDMIVYGRAALLTDPPKLATSWKNTVESAVRRHWGCGYVREPCVVRLTFNLQRSRFKTTALFNLLKQTIDGMGRVVFAPYEYGKVFDTEDWWIRELHAQKQLTDGEPNVRIELSSSFVGCFVDRSDVLIHGIVPGSPPLYAGDENGQIKVVACRATYARHLICHFGIRNGEFIGVDFGFHIEPHRMRNSDLDNFCLPACQATTYAIYGDIAYPHPQCIVDLHAIKMEGTEVRVCRSSAI